MRIPCPHCGDRSRDEFEILGDATVQRPTDGGAAPTPAWEAYVYLRPNPDSIHKELWFHAHGCQRWLVVTRHVRTHEVFGAEDARDVARARNAHASDAHTSHARTSSADAA